MQHNEGQSEAVILVKAAPRALKTHEEGICCIGVTSADEWVRLYNVNFLQQDDLQTFARWSRIRFHWRKSGDDSRSESFIIKQDSLELLGELPLSKRQSFLSRLEIARVEDLEGQGKSLGLLRPRHPHFFMENKDPGELHEEQQHYEHMVQHTHPPGSKALLPLKPCPYIFKYKYFIDGQERVMTYRDWGLNITFDNWLRNFGEAQTVSRLTRIFGKEYPQKGMVFIISKDLTGAWCINGIISMEEVYSTIGHQLDFVA